MLVRRELLSCMLSLYDFVQCCYKSRCRLWSSAAREGSWICNLLPICQANLRRKWDDQITASDASLSGIAVCTRYTDAENVADLARCKEGWRFKVRDFTPPREKALGTHCSRDPFSDPNTVLPVDKLPDDPFSINPDFEKIPTDLMDQGEWANTFAAQMRPYHGA